MQHELHIPADRQNKEKLLEALYSVYQNWVEKFPLACSKGCSFCCTQSVSMSDLEGERILEFIRANNRETWLERHLAGRKGESKGKSITTNQFARLCLEQCEVKSDTAGSWNFASCTFLENNTCSIYEVRPFGCRSFISLEKCSGSSEAEMAPLHLAVNTVFTQIVEHLSSGGGYWSNMLDILKYNVTGSIQKVSGNLLPAQSVPGFLLEVHQLNPVNRLLKQLYEQTGDNQTFGDLIDNFISI